MKPAPVTKEELYFERKQKDKISLQENTLVAFAMAEQPDLYAPNTLPFFVQNQHKAPEPEIVP